MKFAHCLRVVFVIGKYADIFRMVGIFCLGWIYIGRILQDENFQEGKNSRKSFTLEGFKRIPMRNSCKLSYIFLCQLDFECEVVPGELSEGYFQRVLISGKKFQGKMAFPE